VTQRALLLALAVLALSAPSALADSFDQVFKDYTNDGRIDPCKHSAKALAQAKDDVPPDIEQYAPDFPEALDEAIEARARGKCRRAARETAPAPPPTATTGTPAAPPPSGTTGATGSTGAATASPGEPPAPAATNGPAGAPSDDAITRAAAGDRSSDSGAPAPLIFLAVLAGLLALGGAAYGIARWRAWEPPWALRTRHALGEAGWRASATWADFTDWLRLGR